MCHLRNIFQKILEYKAKICIKEIVELDIASKSLLLKYLNDVDLINSASLVRINAVIDYMYERINIGNWKEVKPYLRKTMTIASYVKLLAHFKVANELAESTFKEAFKIIDFGILFGCPIENEPKLLQNCASDLNSLYLQLIEVPANLPSAKNSTTCSKNAHDAIPIKVLNCPSMEHFYTNYILAEKPILLDNCINHWPALTKWKDQNYFIKIAGLRTVSIELGNKYTDSEWTQKLITVEEFIKTHIYQTNSTTGYLAQYQLFDQIPELRKDISEPEYCCFSDSNDPVDIMAWYGPKGTFSPLHHDPKRNLLAQVVGEKQVFLFSPNDSEYLYPHQHEMLDNTARVDPREPDLEKYPKYKDATAYHCILQPGQLLYIPPKWWHCVESLSISFSVSFWWH